MPRLTFVTQGALATVVRAFDRSVGVSVGVRDADTHGQIVPIHALARGRGQAGLDALLVSGGETSVVHHPRSAGRVANQNVAGRVALLVAGRADHDRVRDTIACGQVVTGDAVAVRGGRAGLDTLFMVRGEASVVHHPRSAGRVANQNVSIRVTFLVASGADHDRVRDTVACGQVVTGDAVAVRGGRAGLDTLLVSRRETLVPVRPLVVVAANLNHVSVTLLFTILALARVRIRIGIGIRVGVRVRIGIGVGIGIRVGVRVRIGIGVAVAIRVRIGVGVRVGVRTGVDFSEKLIADAVAFVASDRHHSNNHHSVKLLHFVLPFLKPTPRAGFVHERFSNP